MFSLGEPCGAILSRRRGRRPVAPAAIVVSVLVVGAVAGRGESDSVRPDGKTESERTTKRKRKRKLSTWTTATTLISEQ